MLDEAAKMLLLEKQQDRQSVTNVYQRLWEIFQCLRCISSSKKSCQRVPTDRYGYICYHF